MRTKYWFDCPSEDFSGINGALPFGNGYMGAQIEDNIVYERIALNESTVWSGGPYNNNAKGAYEKLFELRKSAFKGERRDFEWGYEFVRWWGGQITEPCGDLMIYLDNLRATSEYRKEIDLEKGILTTTFKRDKDIIKKEYFASYPKNTICIRYESDLSTFNLISEICAKSTGKLNVDGSFMIFDGKAPGARGVDGKIEYSIGVKVLSDGVFDNVGNRIILSNASYAEFYIKIYSNFISTENLSRDYHSEVIADLNEMVKIGYDTIKEEHVKDFSSFFNRTSFELDSYSDVDDMDLPFNKLRKSFTENVNSSLVELYFNFNKYLIISSTRKGAEPPCLQGRWNDKISPPWDAKYTVNINLEMNYWSFNPLNMPEMIDSLLVKMENVMKMGRITSKEVYNIDRGESWVLHHNTDLWNVCGAIDGCWGLTPVCGAWLTNQLYDKYEYTHDKKYLERVYKLLKGSVEFFLDFLVEYDGYLVTCPSTSPERTNGELGYVTFGSMHDIQILTELFENFIEASLCLDKNDSLNEAKDALKKFPDVGSIGRWGQFKEFYFHDFDFEEDTHRHLAHMYGLYPGKCVYNKHNEEWMKAIKKTIDLRSRPGDWTGWGIAWRMALYARLKDNIKTGEMIRTFLSKDSGLMLQNGFGALPYEDGSAFQYDCNAAFDAVVLESFISSEEGRIDILNSVPYYMQSGTIKGVRCKGSFIIKELRFVENKVTVLTIESIVGGKTDVHVNGNIYSIDLKDNETVRII